MQTWFPWATFHFWNGIDLNEFGGGGASVNSIMVMTNTGGTFVYSNVRQDGK